jgi:hypothetical protein
VGAEASLAQRDRAQTATVAGAREGARQGDRSITQRGL